MVRIPTHREPTHPGEMLLEEFLVPMGITQKELSKGPYFPKTKPRISPLRFIQGVTEKIQAFPAQFLGPVAVKVFTLEFQTGGPLQHDDAVIF